jgi:S-DNA-T family DNA segregation ATPase FtsK/SpoIIIE
MTAKKTRAARAKAPAAARSAAPKRVWLSPARRRELVGAALVAVAVVTVVAFVTSSGSVTKVWTDFLSSAFGWGALLVPVGLGLLGAWLIMDSLDGQADVAWERPIAGVVLFVAVLGLLHLAAARLSDGRTGDILAASHAGGGWVGQAVAGALSLGFGEAGGVVALSAVIIIAWSVMLGHPLRELAASAGRVARRAGAWLRRLGRGEVAAVPLAPTIAVRPPVAPAPAPEAASAEARTAAATDALGRTPAEAVAVDAARPSWRLPTLDEILEPAVDVPGAADDSQAVAALIEATLAEFGIPVKVVEVNRGPTVTQFGLEPGYVEKNGVRSRVKVSRIVALQNDMALALAASPLRILAPVPGRPFVGVEVPNAASTMVTLRSVLESEPFRRLAGRGGLPIALGRDTSGHPVAADLSTMPHCLIAGATGSGKSVAINTLISSLLMTHTPDTLRLLLVDPKRVELVQFQGLPHLAAPVVVDVERVVGVLQWAVREMDRRYKAFAETGSRNLAAYNRQLVDKGQPPLPFLVLVIDELADLMMVAPEEAERLITRLAQLARATGIHLVLATQRPSVDVVTGLIKANFPSRIAFAVSSSIDSRVILDGAGAEKLLGRGDMLYMASDSSKLHRLQGCYVSDMEIERLTRFWKLFQRPAAPAADAALTLGLPPASARQGELFEPLDLEAEVADERDDLFDEAVELVRRQRTASTSFLQRKLRVGYSRAARLLDELEDAGVVGPAQGNQPREVLPEDADGEGREALLDGADDEPPHPRRWT